MPAKLINIYIAKSGEHTVSLNVARLEAGRGIVGDRYYEETGTFSEKLKGNRKREVTFIASEEIDTFNKKLGESLGYGEARRNLVTQGIELKELIGKRFSIGGAVFEGIEHCQPCAHLAAIVNAKVLPHLANTGLRAAIVKSGDIGVGDKIATIL